MRQRAARRRLGSCRLANAGAAAAGCRRRARPGAVAERGATAICLPPRRSRRSAPPSSGAPSARRVPRDFLALADTVLAHSDPRRHAVLYRMLWRLTHGEPHLLKIATDDDVAWTALAAKAVRRDMHKMKAFVRFREVRRAGGRRCSSPGSNPSHDIVARVAPFFVRRFAGMRWSILTPRRSAHWDGETLDAAGRRGRKATRPPTTRWKTCGAPTSPASSIRRG